MEVQFSDLPGNHSQEEGQALFKDRRPLVLDKNAERLYVGGLNQSHYDVHELEELEGYDDDPRYAHGIWFPHGSLEGGRHGEGFAKGHIAWFDPLEDRHKAEAAQHLQAETQEGWNFASKGSSVAPKGHRVATQGGTTSERVQSLRTANFPGPWDHPYQEGESHNYDQWQRGLPGKGFITPDGRLMTWNTQEHSDQNFKAGSPHHEEVAMHMGLGRFPEYSDEAKADDMADAKAEGYEYIPNDPTWHSPFAITPEGKYVMPHQYNSWRGAWKHDPHELLQNAGYDHDEGWTFAKTAEMTGDPFDDEFKVEQEEHGFDVPWEPNTHGKGLQLKDGREFLWKTGQFDGYPTHPMLLAHLNETEGIRWEDVKGMTEHHANGSIRPANDSGWSEQWARELAAKHNQRFVGAWDHPEGDGWTFGKTANYDEWEPGSFGKASLVNGHLVTWKTYTQDGRPTHAEMMEENGWSDGEGDFHITPEGRLDFVGVFDAPKEEHAFAQALAQDKRLTRGESGWHFGKTASYVTPEGYKPWVPGAQGRYVTDDQGVEHRWHAGRLGDSDIKFHQDFMRAHPHLMPKDYGYITPEGEQSSASAGRTQWRLGAAPQHGWTPGNTGKGMIVDGEPVTWNTRDVEDMGSPDYYGPHHEEVLQNTFGIEMDDRYGEGRDRWHSPVYINEQGDVFGMDHWGEQEPDLNPFARLGLNPIDEREHGWRFASTNEINYMPGEQHKGYISEDGEIHVWPTQEGKPHHTDIMADNGHVEDVMDDYGYHIPFMIDEHGAIGTAREGDQSEVEHLPHLIPGTHINHDAEYTWRFGAKVGKTSAAHTASHDWTGGWGKWGVEDDGVIHSWDTDGEEGRPHHSEYLDPDRIVATGDIDPDGTTYQSLGDGQWHDALVEQDARLKKHEGWTFSHVDSGAEPAQLGPNMSIQLDTYSHSLPPRNPLSPLDFPLNPLRPPRTDPCSGAYEGDARTTLSSFLSSLTPSLSAIDNQQVSMSQYPDNGREPGACGDIPTGGLAHTDSSVKHTHVASGMDTDMGDVTLARYERVVNAHQLAHIEQGRKAESRPSHKRMVSVANIREPFDQSERPLRTLYHNTDTAGEGAGKESQWNWRSGSVWHTAWEPGYRGKGLVDYNGKLHSWIDDKLQGHSGPHHIEYASMNNIEFDPDHSFFIDEQGHVSGLGRELDELPVVEALKQDGRLRPDPAEGWHFANGTPGNPSASDYQVPEVKIWDFPSEGHNHIGEDFKIADDPKNQWFFGSKIADATVEDLLPDAPTHYNSWTGLPCNCPWGRSKHHKHKHAGVELNRVLKAPDKAYRTPEGEQFRKDLPTILGEDYDALAPYLANRWKKGDIYHIPGTGDYAPHLQYDAEYGKQRVPLQNWHKWYQARQHPLRRGVDVMHPDFSPDKFQEAADEHQRLLQNEHLLKDALLEGREDYKFPNGWHVRHITDEDANIERAMQAEGQAMGHCIGNDEQPYVNAALSGATNVFSLRDPRNLPHATWHTDSNGGIAEIHGNVNKRLAPHHQEMYDEWTKHRGIDPHPSGETFDEYLDGEDAEIWMPGADDVSEYLDHHHPDSNRYYYQDAYDYGNVGENTEIHVNDPNWDGVVYDLQYQSPEDRENVYNTVNGNSWQSPARYRRPGEEAPITGHHGEFKRQLEDAAGAEPEEYAHILQEYNNNHAKHYDAGGEFVPPETELHDLGRRRPRRVWRTQQDIANWRRQQQQQNPYPEQTIPLWQNPSRREEDPIWTGNPIQGEGLDYFRPYFRAKIANEDWAWDFKKYDDGWRKTPEPWELGMNGKGAFLENGRPVVWTVDKDGWPRHGDDHLPDPLKLEGGGYDTAFHIDPKGNAHFHFPDHIEQRHIDALKPLGINLDPSTRAGWKFANTPWQNGGHDLSGGDGFITEPWEKGDYGKGFIHPNGTVHTWSTYDAADPYKSDIHHYEVLDSQGTDVGNASPFHIDPEGRVQTWNGKMDDHARDVIRSLPGLSLHEDLHHPEWKFMSAWTPTDSSNDQYWQWPVEYRNQHNPPIQFTDDGGMTAYRPCAICSGQGCVACDYTGQEVQKNHPADQFGSDGATAPHPLDMMDPEFAPWHELGPKQGSVAQLVNGGHKYVHFKTDNVVAAPPWQLGLHGKGTYDESGTPHLWAIDELASPHHDEALDYHGTTAHGGYFYIDPDGSVEGWGEDGRKRAEGFAAHHPDLHVTEPSPEWVFAKTATQTTPKIRWHGQKLGWQDDHSMIYTPETNELHVGSPDMHHADLIQALNHEGYDDMNPRVYAAYYDDGFEVYPNRGLSDEQHKHYEDFLGGALGVEPRPTSWAFSKIASKIDWLESRPDKFKETPEGKIEFDVLKKLIERNPKADPLAPWLWREIKKGRAEVNSPLLSHWADWYKSNSPTRRGVDIMQKTWDEVQELVDQWDDELAAKETEADQANGQVVYQYSNGWTMRELGPNDLDYEGDQMGHCVGGYNYERGVEVGDISIYSLRDEKNVPHATIEMANRVTDYRDNKPIKWDAPELEQIQGKGNTILKPEYQAMVKEFFSTLPVKPIWREGDVVTHIDELPGGGEVHDPEYDHGWGGYGPHGDYGIDQTKPKVDYNDVVESLKQEGGGWRGEDRYEPEDVRRLYEHALKHGEIKPLVDATQAYSENEVQPDLDRIREMNWEYFDWPGDTWEEGKEMNPERFADEDEWENAKWNYEYAENELQREHVPSQIEKDLWGYLTPHYNKETSQYENTVQPKTPTVFH